MTSTGNGGLQLLERVAKAWSSCREDFESECRSGSRSSSAPPVVENLVQDVAQLFEQLARQELEAIRQHYYSPEALPNRTVDFTPAPSVLGTEDGRGDPTPMQTMDFTPSSDAVPSAETQELGTPDPNAATGTFDRWRAAAAEGFLADPGFEEPAKKEPRKLPRIPGYEITGTLGHGGMGVVYKARQEGLNRDVALKMILKGEHASSSAVVRFLTEARAIAQLNHPNIVQIYEINEYDDLPYFSLEFCAGGSLDRRLKKEPIPPERAAELAETLARALAVAHKAGVLHRDMKPGNVLLDANGVPKITDFGLARMADDDSGLTATNSILGSPSYMPPEQAGGGMDKVCAASDQYSLGATLYEFLTGRPPFQGTSPIETVRQVRELEPVPPSKLQPTCPKDLETICLKALSKEIEKRYPTAEAFADDLKAFREGRPISARPVGPVERLWRWSKRNKKLAALSAGIVALAVALIVGSTVAALVFREKNVAISKALDDVKEQKRQSDENYSYARENGVTFLSEVPRIMDKQPLTRGVRADLAKIVQRVIGDSSGSVRALPDRMLLFARITQGSNYLVEGKFADAEKEYQSALELAKNLAVDETNEKDKAQGHIAWAYESLGQLEKFRYYESAKQKSPNQAAFDKSEQQYRAAETIQRERLANPLSNELPEIERKQSLAGCLVNLASLLFPDPEAGGRGVPVTLANVEKATTLLSEAEALQQQVVAAERTEGTRYRALPLMGNINFQLYRANLISRKAADAKAYLEKAIAISEKIIAEEPSPADKLTLARRYRLMGDWHIANSPRAEAAPWDQKAYDQLRGVVVVPELQGILNELASDHYRVGSDSLTTSPAKALANFRACLRLRELLQTYGDASTQMQIKVMVAAARCGQTTRTVKLIEPLLNAKGADRDYNTQRELALVYAICAGTVGTGDEAGLSKDEVAARRKQYTETAIAMLQTCQKLLDEYKAPQPLRERFREILRTDPDLDGVRSAPAFLAMVNAK